LSAAIKIGGAAMAIITWNNTLSVGIKQIDEQHQLIVKLINNLNEAMKDGKGKDVLGRILKGLADYTISHFKVEEDYFDRFSYPDRLAHKKAHSEFVTKVDNFKKSLENGQLALSVQVMTFLSDWLFQHIQGVDRKYSNFFAAQGLK
jgi:hemerythrin